MMLPRGADLLRENEISPSAASAHPAMAVSAAAINCGVMWFAYAPMDRKS